MFNIKQTLFRLFAIFAVAILPIFGMGMAGEGQDAPESVIQDNEVYTTTESQVNSSGVRVEVYRGRNYYYRPYYYNYPHRSYYRRYHAPRPRYPRYNYRYYYYENYRPYGPAYYGN
jgi:hypothetical protein